ncbi:MAG: DNA integrity scanning diadenylate cyclase DisA [Acidimicrobiia bacterium]|nr:DNA integrity scanning diadenylate cyclase DisA [Acidimicrobiia bacterium]
MVSRAPDSYDVLRRFAPGTPLRIAVELIHAQGTGALIVIGSGPTLDAVCSGGFFLEETTFTAQRLAELSKMDGGIVVDDERNLITRANVHFIPDPDIETYETGTRFRTAERLALQTGDDVLAVSEESWRTAVVYRDGRRYELARPSDLLASANNSLNSLERLRRRLQSAEDRLSRAEVDDVVSTRDVLLVLARATLVKRMFAEIERTLVALGGEAKLITIQATDLIEGVDELADNVFADYRKRRGKRSVFDRLSDIATDELHDLSALAAALGFPEIEEGMEPRGIRALTRVPRLPDAVRQSLVSHFRGFQRMLHASVADLEKVEGVGRTRAQQLRRFFDRMIELGDA